MEHSFDGLRIKCGEHYGVYKNGRCTECDSRLHVTITVLSDEEITKCVHCGVALEQKTTLDGRSKYFEHPLPYCQGEWNRRSSTTSTGGA
jgi:hypothetical protein